MEFFKSESNNPYFNLAMEEYCLKNFDKEMFIIWQNEPTIVIGRNQNTLAEVYIEKAKEENVNIVRRETGGGAVYHDLGNINFSFIVNLDYEKTYSYDYFLQPIVNVLKSYDIDVNLSGRNDLQIGNKKVSGNAQTIYKNRILHHGTLLFDSDLTVMSAFLNPSKAKLKSKGVNSVLARVGNISEFLKTPKTKDDFISDIKQEILKDKNICSCVLKPNELEEVIKLQKTKYETWDWNFGKSPKANYKNQNKLSFGELTVNLLIENGKINDCKLYTDALLMFPIKKIEELFIGQKYNISTMKEIIDEVVEDKYFNTDNKQELLEVFISQN